MVTSGMAAFARLAIKGVMKSMSSPGASAIGAARISTKLVLDEKECYRFSSKNGVFFAIMRENGGRVKSPAEPLLMRLSGCF